MTEKILEFYENKKIKKARNIIWVPGLITRFYQYFLMIMMKEKIYIKNEKWII